MTSQTIAAILSAPPQQKITALNQLQNLALSLTDPTDPQYQDFLTSAKPYFSPDQWQKITSVDSEDQDLPDIQQALLIPGKIIAALLSQIQPGQTRTIKEIVDEYQRHQSQTKTALPTKPPTTNDQRPTSLSLGLKKAASLASRTTLKTPFSKSLPKIVLTPQT